MGQRQQQQVHRLVMGRAPHNRPLLLLQPQGQGQNTNNLWLCPFCNKLLSAKGSLTQHVGSKHEGDETCRGEAMKTYLQNMDRWLCGPRLINNAALNDCITPSSYRGIPTTGECSRHHTNHHQASPLPQPPPTMQTTPSLYKT